MPDPTQHTIAIATRLRTALPIRSAGSDVELRHARDRGRDADYPHCPDHGRSGIDFYAQRRRFADLGVAGMPGCAVAARGDDCGGIRRVARRCHTRRGRIPRFIARGRPDRAGERLSVGANHRLRQILAGDASEDDRRGSPAQRHHRGDAPLSAHLRALLQQPADGRPRGGQRELSHDEHCRVLDEMAEAGCLGCCTRAARFSRGGTSSTSTRTRNATGF